MASGLITSWQIDGEKMETVTDFIFLGSKTTADGECSYEISSRKKSYDQPRQHIEKQRHYFANKGPSSQSYGFSNLENSAVATGMEKVSFHSNPKERQCQRMLKLPHNCTHLTRWYK